MNMNMCMYMYTSTRAYEYMENRYVQYTTMKTQFPITLWRCIQQNVCCILFVDYARHESTEPCGVDSSPCSRQGGRVAHLQFAPFASDSSLPSSWRTKELIRSGFTCEGGASAQTSFQLQRALIHEAAIDAARCLQLRSCCLAAGSSTVQIYDVGARNRLTGMWKKTAPSGSLT